MGKEEEVAGSDKVGEARRHEDKTGEWVGDLGAVSGWSLRSMVRE